MKIATGAHVTVSVSCPYQSCYHYITFEPEEIKSSGNEVIKCPYCKREFKVGNISP